jgi:type IV pilus biogenesis protein CpaD/CtpE
MKTSKTILLAALLALGLGCGYSAKSTTPAVAGTMPTVSALAPSSVAAGSPSFVLTVNGTNFNGNAAINLNSTAQMTSHVSANQLTATVPAASVATAGTVTVTVTNPGTAGGIYGGGTAAETSNSMTFTIN